nr:methyltransferase domain-containing protein [Nitrospira sp.]
MDILSQNWRATVKRMLPISTVNFIRGLRRPRVNFGDLGGIPISRDWGFDRGAVIDRYYMERFLTEHQDAVRGRVLEIEHDCYTQKFGSAVTHSDVLFVWPDCPRGKHATIIDDLTTGAKLETNAYDCIILTQTLPFIYDLRRAVRTIHRILKPGGVVLVTVPSITKVSSDDVNSWGDYWRFTTQSLTRLFEEFFGKSPITTQTYGNVQVASAFLYGLAIQDLKAGALEQSDPEYPVLIGLRAQKGVTVLSEPRTVDSVDNEAVLVRAFDGEIYYCNP